MGNILSYFVGNSGGKIKRALPDIHQQKSLPIDESDSDSEYESCTEDEAYITSSNVSSQKRNNSRKKFIYHNPRNKEIFTTEFFNTSASSTLLEPSAYEDLPSWESTCNEDANKSTCSESEMLTALDINKDKTQTVVDETKYVLASGDNNTNNNGKLKGSMAWEINISNDSKIQKKNSKLKVKRKPLKRYKIAKNSVTTITNEEIAERKVFDLRRWHCMSRPQYKRSCGISSLVSVWNYLYSKIGAGHLPPITQEEALKCLGFKEPFGEIRFGPFTGNATLMRWFKRLNAYFGVKGRAYYLFKPKGSMRTQFMTEDDALSHLQGGLKSDRLAYIYHCYNHYFCPIGYEDSPWEPTAAYCKSNEISGDTHTQTADESDAPDKLYETWILIGENSKKQPTIHCKKWSDILLDLNMESPNYFNIRHPEKGIMVRKTKKTGRNLHCIIAFKKI